MSSKRDPILIHVNKKPRKSRSRSKSKGQVQSSVLAKGKVKRIKSFAWTDDEKKKLAGIVKQYTEIWKLSDPLYRKPDAQAAAWNRVAVEMSMEVDLCKKAWRSLKDSFRHQKLGKPKKVGGKSGDPAMEEDSDNEEMPSSDEILDSWKFKECLNFMVAEKNQRRTLTTINCGLNTNSSIPPVDTDLVDDIDEPNFDTEETCDMDAQNKTSLNDVRAGPNILMDCDREPMRKSNYSYMKKKETNVLESGTSKLVEGISELINLRKMEASQSVPPVDNKTKLKYISMYNNMDRMLKKLPEFVVEDLNMEFLNTIHLKLKEFQQVVIITPESQEANLQY